MGLALFLHAEANPEWRLLSWMGALVATGLSVLLLLHAAGGGRWAGHFAFPIFLFWLAVPWPRPWEARLMQHLMQMNAYLAAELVRWVGVEAVSTGNVIRLKVGAVGVEEACSGIRSLYGSLMVGVFLGEWFSLTVVRRIWLAFAALVIALATNLGRSMLLVGMADSRGIKAMETWHDMVGYLFMALCFVGIVAAGWLLKSRRRHGKTADRPSTTSSPFEVRFRATWQAVSAGVFMVMLLAAVLGIRLWYGGGVSAAEKTPGGWTVEFPKNAPGFSSVPVSRAVESFLHFDYGESARWNDVQSRRWAGFYFRWDAGRNSYHDLFVHDPTVCMSGLGMTLERDLGLATGLTSGNAMPVHEYVFKDGGAEVYVFNCLAEDGAVLGGGGVDGGGLTWANRWRAAVQGRNNGIKRRLELAVWGVHSDAEARAAFQDFLSSCWHDLRASPSLIPSSHS